MLKQFFPDIVDVGFTAGMETKLDDIANGDMERVEMLREFYGPFDAALDHAFQNAQRVRRVRVRCCERYQMRRRNRTSRTQRTPRRFLGVPGVSDVQVRDGPAT